jgi:hypothetical protein
MKVCKNLLYLDDKEKMNSTEMVITPHLLMTFSDMKRATTSIPEISVRLNP